MNATWNIDATRILTRNEVVSVLKDIRRRARRSVNTRMNLTIFRLATCCGLRVSEICGLRMKNVRVGIELPYIQIPKTIAKGGKARRVPLWWDAGTLDDITRWKKERQEQGAGPEDFFVCSQSKAVIERKLDRRNVRARFISSCRILGKERAADLTIHDGRHTFISHALAGGRTLAEVKEAAGHKNVSTTSIYIHIAVGDDGTVGDLFKFDV